MKAKNSKSTKSNTGYKGICFVKKIGKFKAQVSINRGSRDNQITIEIGVYETLKDAIKSRENYIIELL